METTMNAEENNAYLFVQIYYQLPSSCSSHNFILKKLFTSEKHIFCGCAYKKYSFNSFYFLSYISPLSLIFSEDRTLFDSRIGHASMNVFVETLAIYEARYIRNIQRAIACTYRAQGRHLHAMPALFKKLKQQLKLLLRKKKT